LAHRPARAQPPGHADRASIRGAARQLRLHGDRRGRRGVRADMVGVLPRRPGAVQRAAQRPRAAAHVPALAVPRPGASAPARGPAPYIVRSMAEAVTWPDAIDEVLGGDMVAALAYTTPAKGAVAMAVGPIGLR